MQEQLRPTPPVDAETHYSNDQGVFSNMRLGLMDLYSAENRNFRDELVNSFELPSENESILEIGCNDGTNLYKIRNERGFNGPIIGVDISITALSSGRSNIRSINTNPIDFRYGDMANLPVETGSQKIVLVPWVLHHAKDDNHLHAALDEITRVMAPDGEAIFAINSKDQKQLHTIMLNRAAKELGRSVSPRFANRFCIENACQMLEAHSLLPQEPNHQKTVMVFPSFSDLMLSLETYHNLFTPSLSGGDGWEQAKEIWRDEYKHQLDLYGAPVTDNIDRWILKATKAAS